MLKNLLNRILQGLDFAFFPATCIHCNRRIRFRSDSSLCKRCRTSIPSLKGGRCENCALFLGPGIPNQKSCSNCRDRTFHFDRAIALGRYHPPLRNWIHDMKFRCKPSLGVTLGRLLGKKLKKRGLNGSLDGIVSVPLTPLRETQRGFNQAYMISRGVSEIVEIPVLTDVLVKSRSTPPQVELTRKERLSNIETDVFSVRKPGKIRGKDLLLVDDVMTTGGTANACSQSLRKEGVESICIGVLAR